MSDLVKEKWWERTEEEERAFWDSVVHLTIQNQLRCMELYKQTKDPYWLDEAEFYREKVEQFKQPSCHQISIKNGSKPSSENAPDATSA